MLHDPSEIILIYRFATQLLLVLNIYNGLIINVKSFFNVFKLIHVFFRIPWWIESSTELLQYLFESKLNPYLINKNSIFFLSFNSALTTGINDILLYTELIENSYFNCNNISQFYCISKQINAVWWVEETSFKNINKS